MFEKFTSLTPRQQSVMVLVVFLIMGTAYYTLVWAPVYDAQTVQRKEFSQVMQNKEAVQHYVTQIQELQVSGGSSDSPVIENLTSHVNQSLQSRGLTLTQIQQVSGDQLQLRLENAAFSSVLGWIYDLENTPGLMLEEIAIRPSGTTQTGQINITVGLSQID